MANIEVAPFANLVEHPNIGLHRGHFYQVPDRSDLLVRALDKPANSREIQDLLDYTALQREALDDLATNYLIPNSGFLPICAEGGVYVVTRVIDGPNLSERLVMREPDGIRAANSLLTKLLHYSLDFQQQGGFLIFDVYTPEQYMVENQEPVLVDLDITQHLLQDTGSPISKFIQLDQQLGPLSLLACELRVASPGMPAPLDFMQFLMKFRPGNKQQADLLEVLIESIERGDREPIEGMLYDEPSWDEADDFRTT